MADWFEIAKEYDLKSYLETQYRMEFKKNFALCPFHADSKPTFSVQTTKNFFNCFACGTGGDIVKFVELHDKLSPLEAVKKVLADHGVEVGNVKELSAEEKAKRDAELAKIRAEAEKRKKAAAAKEARARKRALEEMAKIAPALSENLYTARTEGNEPVLGRVVRVLPRFFNLDSEIIDVALGWDYEHDSIVILNRDLDGNVFNIKHRQKKGFDGKWISWAASTVRPFGADFWNADDDRVIVCEGEKDALNLMSYGINAVTLGGVTTGWEPYREILKDKRVFVWFDNDRAGYEESVKRWAEIKTVAKSCHVVLFYKLGRFENKYDISDYLQDHSFSAKEEIFDRILYSCFTITNDLIDEIVELVSENIDEKELLRLREVLAAYRSEGKILTFRDIRKDILDACKDVKGEKDGEAQAMEFLGKELERSHIAGELEKLINSLFAEAPGQLEKLTFKLREVVRFKASLLNQYRQTHIADMVTELERATGAAGYMFATYRDALYIWTGNYYYLLEKWEIEKFILRSFFRAARVDFKKQLEKNSLEVLANIKAISPALEEWIDPGKRAINMLNGTLIVPKSGRWIFKSVHSKKDCALNILPVEYDPEAKAPKWQKFLNRVLPDKDDQAALMEFFGYCFLPSHRFETFLLLYGSTGANGKSVILQVMAAFFGRENISSLQLHEFEGHPLAMLKGKILNIGTEIESGGDLKKQFSTLKAMISPNDSIAINPKNKDGYDLWPEEKPKMAFASNKLPKSGMDGGVFRRALVFEMDQEIKDNEKVRDLVERFADERDGILNMALEGLQRLERNNRFTMSQRRADFMEEYKDDVNPVRAYISECIVKSPGVIVAKKFVYEHYRAWCEDKGLQPYAVRTFWGKVKEQMRFKEMNISSEQYANKHLPKKTRFLADFAISEDAIDEFKVNGEDIKVREINISKVGFYPVGL